MTLEEIIKYKPDNIHDVIEPEFFTKYDKSDYIYCKNYYEWNYAIAKYLQPKTFLEIGVRLGFSFLPTLIGAESLEYAEGWDIESYVKNGNKMSTENISKYYNGLCKWSISNINSQEIDVLPQKFDFINIDGCHDYDCKKHDLKLAMDNCKYALLDDYDYHFYVKDAIDDFMNKNINRIESSLYVPTFRGSMLIKFKGNE